MPLTDEDEIYERTFAGEDWSRRTMTRITFEACRFERCDFREANLTGAICTFTDFSRALFGKSILSGADFLRRRQFRHRRLRQSNRGRQV